MYKNLLVNIPTERSPHPAIDGAVALAASCKAELHAVAVGYECSTNLPLIAEGGAAVAAHLRVRARKGAGARACRACRIRGGSPACRRRSTSSPRHQRAAGRSRRHRRCGRRASTTSPIVEQPEFGRDTYDNMLAAGNPVPVGRTGVVHALYLPRSLCRQSASGFAGTAAALPRARCAMRCRCSNRPKAITIITIDELRLAYRTTRRRRISFVASHVSACRPQSRA